MRLCLLGVAAGLLRRSGAPQLSLLGFHDEGNSSAPQGLTFNHMPKCGGTFVKSVVQRCVPSARIEDEFDSLQPSDAFRFVIGLVRDPFAYYVSLWTYNSCGCGTFREALTPFQQSSTLVHHRCSCPDRRTVSHHGAPLGTYPDEVARFRKWLPAVNSPDVGTETLRFYYSYVQQPRAAYSKDSARGHVGRVISPQEIQHHFANFQAEWKRICWVRTEDLVATFKKCLQKYEAAGGHVNWAAFTVATAHTHKNASPHVATSKFYDQASTDLVLRADAELFKYFGYPHSPHD